MKPIIRSRKMNSQPTDVGVWTLSDAPFNMVTGSDYRQTGIVTGIKFQMEKN